MECPFCTLDPDSLSGQIPRQPGACAGGAKWHVIILPQIQTTG
jgi:hypothetical protein